MSSSIFRLHSWTVGFSLNLTILGRFHAKSRLDGIVSVLWSLLLKATNKSGIKWFVCCMASKLQSADHLQSSKMASMAYYMLTKIEFAEYDRTKASRWSLFSYVSHVSYHFIRKKKQTRIFLVFYFLIVLMQDMNEADRPLLPKSTTQISIVKLKILIRETPVYNLWSN